MREFTGERVIPGEVSDDLWAEHLARYAFASRRAAAARVLDVGCGAGYGTAELAQHARVATGIDVAPDAIAYARAHYPLPNLRFLPASATALPFAAHSFDLVTAFEVVEHLSDWRALLSEARRVLHPGGVFLVSTPNKLYYSESRAQEGPNPFHAHEFEFAEFHQALSEFFPHATVLLQNRIEAFAFYPHASFLPLDARLDGTRGSPEDANFFLAICSLQPLPEIHSFLYVPRAANLLREREQHIQLLQRELEETKQSLAGVIANRQELIDVHDRQTRHLEAQNHWALELDRKWHAGLLRIAALQNELEREQTAGSAMAAGFARHITELEQESRKRLDWGHEIEQRLTAQLRDTIERLDAAEATIVERSLWAKRLDERIQYLEAQLHMVRESRWLKLGRTFNLGPELDKSG